MALRLRLLHLAIVLLLLGGCSPAPKPEPESSFVPTPLHRELERELDGKLMTEGIRISNATSYDHGEVQVVQVQLWVSDVAEIDERDPYRVFAAIHRLGHLGASSVGFYSKRWNGRVHVIDIWRAEGGQISQGEGQSEGSQSLITSYVTGTAEGVTPELIASIAEGDAPLPVFEPLPEGVGHEWDPVTGLRAAEPEEY